MFLLEFFEEIPDGFESEGEDNSIVDLNDTRNTRLTLAHINKIRVMNDLRKYERFKDIKKVRQQFGSTEGGDEEF